MGRRKLILFIFFIFSAVTIGTVSVVGSVDLEYGDLIMDSKMESMEKAGVKPVVFPHWFHRIRFKCKVCHEEIFILKKGANDITMKAIMEGEFCGKCHNGVIAWEPIYCDRCHRYEPEADPNRPKEVKIEKGKKYDPDDPNNPIYLSGLTKKLAGTGDPDKPASQYFEEGQDWHPQVLKEAGLPTDKYGLVDWAKAVKEGYINPKGTLDPNEEEFPIMDLDIIIEAKSDFVNDVLFPHWIHTYWLRCDVCHPKIFIPERGKNPMTMAEIAQGQWCGRCHGKVAFPLTDCTRCHIKPKETATAAEGEE